MLGSGLERAQYSQYGPRCCLPCDPGRRRYAGSMVGGYSVLACGTVLLWVLGLFVGVGKRGWFGSGLVSWWSVWKRGLLEFGPPQYQTPSHLLTLCVRSHTEGLVGLIKTPAFVGIMVWRWNLSPDWQALG